MWKKTYIIYLKTRPGLIMVSPIKIKHHQCPMLQLKENQDFSDSTQRTLRTVATPSRSGTSTQIPREHW